MTRALTIWLLACMSMWFGATISQAQDAKRVVVLNFDGPGSATVRSHVVAALGDRAEVEMVSARQVDAAVQRLGITLDSAESYQRVAAELQVSAFVEGTVEKDKKHVLATIRVRDASTGLVAHEEPWRRKKLPQLKDIQDNFWQIMGPHIQAASAPAAPEPEPEPEPEPAPVARTEPEPEEEQPEAEPEPERGPTGKSHTHPALVVWAGPQLLWRILEYSGATDLNLYENKPGEPAFTLVLGGAWFPGAHARADWLSDIGLEAELDYALGLQSRQDNKKYKTTAYQFSAGAVYRIPLDAFEPRIRVGYVKHVFDAKVPDTTLLPGVSYSAVRFGLGTAVNLAEWLSLDVGAAYLMLLDSGEIGTDAYASKLSSKGWEANAGITTRFKQAYGLRLGFDYRRYSHDMSSSPDPMNALLPDEAKDTYMRATLAFVYSIAGVSDQPASN